MKHRTIPTFPLQRGLFPQSSCHKKVPNRLAVKTIPSLRPFSRSSFCQRDKWENSYWRASAVTSQILSSVQQKSHRRGQVGEEMVEKTGSPKIHLDTTDLVSCKSENPSQISPRMQKTRMPSEMDSKPVNMIKTGVIQSYYLMHESDPAAFWTSWQLALKHQKATKPSKSSNTSTRGKPVCKTKACEAGATKNTWIAFPWYIWPPT